MLQHTIGAGLSPRAAQHARNEDDKDDNDADEDDNEEDDNEEDAAEVLELCRLRQPLPRGASGERRRAAL